MLGLQKTFLLGRFFNWIPCNKDLKAKIPRFFTCVFCLTPRPGAGMFYEQKDPSFLTYGEEIQKSASTELYKWSENVANVENRQFLKENCKFLSVI